MIYGKGKPLYAKGKMRWETEDRSWETGQRGVETERASYFDSLINLSSHRLNQGQGRESGEAV